MVPVREPKTYSILLADELTLVREGLAALCEAQPQYRVVGQCSDGASAMRLIELQRPDIAVLDLNLPDLFTLELVKRMKETGVVTKVVVLSTRRDRKTVVEALRCGVSAFLLKSGPSIQLLEAFGQILDGGIYVSPELELNKIFSPGQKSASEDPLQSLSAREYQVFSLLVRRRASERDRRPAFVESQNGRHLSRQPDAQARYPRCCGSGEVRNPARPDLFPLRVYSGNSPRLPRRQTSAPTVIDQPRRPKLAIA